MDLKNLGTRLAGLRKKSALSQRQAAEKLGISPAPLSAYELGKKLPPLETLAAMAELYHVSLDYLCGNEHAEKSAAIPKAAKKRDDFLRCLSALCLSGLPVKMTSQVTTEQTVAKFINSPIIPGVAGGEYLDWECPIATSISFVETYDKTDPTAVPWLATFCKKYENLLRLSEEHDIDDDVLEAWMDKQLKAAEGQYMLHAPETDDSPTDNDFLPFEIVEPKEE